MQYRVFRRLRNGIAYAVGNFRCFRHVHHSTYSASPVPHQLFNCYVPDKEVILPHSELTSLQDLVSGYHFSELQDGSTSTVSHISSIISSDTYEYLVYRYQNSCCLNDAFGLHLLILKAGLMNDVFMSNTLINIYVRISDMVSAVKYFDVMPQKNLVSWACMISGYNRKGIPEEACLLFKRMTSEGFLPNNYAFSSALRACQQCGPPGLKLAEQIHGLTCKSIIESDVMVCNALMQMYATCLRNVDDARQVFDHMSIKDLTSWNSMISLYSQRGDANPAFELFSDMRRENQQPGFGPNEYTFGSLISVTCCLDDCGLTLLYQMLAMIAKAGFLKDLYVGSALVSSFARFGSVDCAKFIFSQMYKRTAVSLNGLLVGLVRQKRGEEAVEVFNFAKEFVELNRETFVVLLSACPEFCFIDEGKRKGQELHAYLIRMFLLDNSMIAIGNVLINMYAKCRAINDAWSAFRLMDDKDLVSWNSMIASFDQNEQFEDAVISFYEMRRSGFMPSNFSLISSLSSCASLGWIFVGQQIHAEGLKVGLDEDVSVGNALLAMYAETGFPGESHKLFSLMPKYDQVSWNSLIGALANSDTLVLEAIRYFQCMMKSAWKPNTVTFINILAAVSSLSLYQLGQQIHALVLKYSFVHEKSIENALMACYGKCGQMTDSKQIFYEMADRRDEISWNSMISCYIHNELLPKAMDLVWFMMQRGQRLDSFTLATVLSACASVATLERGMEVHACGLRACLESDVVVGSALVDMYAKCGRLDYASRFFSLMPVRNIYSWNSMISGYARHGHGTEALRLFKQMKEHGQSPDHVTFVGVLSACSHVGLVDEGFDHFKSMNELYGLTLRIEHYSCMVDLLGRAGEVQRIDDLIKNMPIDPNIFIWRTVLGACGRANGRYTELGKRAGRMLLELEPQNAVNYVLLANMYASGGKWEDVAQARNAMRKAAVKKETGCSWVTMKDGIHVFVAGDKSHPEKDLIYNKLREINQKIRDIGYVPETKFALYDLEHENKEEILSYHSEKLAIAFVLCRKSELPIRIMKNLRVCGDCHAAFKYISEIVNRQIVLRDSHRFHHFNSGKCSCGDYW